MHNLESVEILRNLEQLRCNALVDGDRQVLAGLLHKDLIHVHAKGHVDTYDGYLESGGFGVDYLRVERGELNIRVLGDVALMTGRQTLEAQRKSSREKLRIDSHVTQVWLRTGNAWQQMAFQTTPTEFVVSPAV